MPRLSTPKNKSSARRSAPKTVRVVSGFHRGRILKTPKTSKTHPMGSREKLALINRILPYLESSVVLDLYAGSGALGIEAISNGAAVVVFIENSMEAVKTISENLKSLNTKCETSIMKGKTEDFLREIIRGDFLAKGRLMFDIVIADPPYDSFPPPELDKIFCAVRPGGILVLSHPGEPPTLPFLALISTKSYAAANISLYQRIGTPNLNTEKNHQ